MNRMIVVIFAGQTEAYVGVRALRQLHEEGSLALYSLGVIAKSDQGVVTILETDGPGSVGTGVGMAVGGLIGMLGGPVGSALGAVAGSLAGALRVFWVAGVSLDFVEDTEKLRWVAPGDRWPNCSPRRIPGSTHWKNNGPMRRDRSKPR